MIRMLETWHFNLSILFVTTHLKILVHAYLFLNAFPKRVRFFCFSYIFRTAARYLLQSNIVRAVLATYVRVSGTDENSMEI